MRYTKYVLGFIFDTKFERVLLMQKERPTWQAKKFNGIGGHIEPGETPRQAMFREAGEEVDQLKITGWKPIFTLKDVEHCGLVHVFSTQTNHIQRVVAKGDEAIKIFSVYNLQGVIINVTWMIPMAISLYKGERCRGFSVVEL